MTALRDVSKVWLVAKMVHTLFESILGNKILEERLQKAAGRKHTKGKFTNGNSTKTNPTPPTEPTAAEVQAQKRKYDDMELGYTHAPPAPQMSYERSRPQSPALTPSRELPNHSHAAVSRAQQQLPQVSTTSPVLRHSTDAFMGVSRANTRPTTPFNTFSYPGTPPDLFLHTRGSPKISEDLWQNYAPDQLFPPEANGMFPTEMNGLFATMQSPGASMVDPALRGPVHNVQQAQMPPQPQTHLQPPPQHQHMPVHDPQHLSHMSGASQLPTFTHDSPAWIQLQAMQGASGPQHQRPDDQWSNTSSTGPIVPTTLNVGDWFEFFGIPNGDMSALSGVAGGAGGYG